MVLSALIVSFGAFLSTFAGGLIALRAVRYVGVIIALGAGIRIGAIRVETTAFSVEPSSPSDCCSPVAGAVIVTARQALPDPVPSETFDQKTELPSNERLVASSNS